MAVVLVAVYEMIVCKVFMIFTRILGCFSLSFIYTSYYED
jgi:hypothetical protein